MSSPAATARTALITGASSGIGESFARLLAGRGYNLILVARRADRLDSLARELQLSAKGIRVTDVVADLSGSVGRSSVSALLEQNRVDLLINNAGFGVYTPVAETAPAVLDAMVQVNVLAVLELTRAALPGMLERKHGAIINVASGLAFDPAATRATYSGTKGFVVNFTRATHEEVADRGVQLQVLIPGLIRTEFHDHSGTDITRFPDSILMDPTDLAAASLAGLELGEVVCVPALGDPQQIETALRLQTEVARTLVKNGTPVDRFR